MPASTYPFVICACTSRTFLPRTSSGGMSGRDSVPSSCTGIGKPTAGGGCVPVGE